MPTLVTWNLQGSRGIDIDAVARTLDSTDIAVLQEVQRRQAIALAAALGWQALWTFKHHPIRTAAEGLAVLAPRLQPFGTVIKLQGGWPWSFRRRVALPVTVGDLVVVNTHLGMDADEGLRQAALLMKTLDERGRPGRLLVVGDLNALPATAVLGTFLGAGLRDAWSGESGSGATNWPQKFPRTGPPTQRLDYVLVSPGMEVLDASVPVPEEAAAFAALSDHVPLSVRLV